MATRDGPELFTDAVRTAGMESDRAQLSAIETTLEDLTRRVTAIAAHYQGSPREDVSHALYDTERALMRASRQLTKTMRLMRR
jgi:hypothetical protein